MRPAAGWILGRGPRRKALQPRRSDHPVVPDIGNPGATHVADRDEQVLQLLLPPRQTQQDVIETPARMRVLHARKSQAEGLDPLAQLDELGILPLTSGPIAGVGGEPVSVVRHGREPAHHVRHPVLLEKFQEDVVAGADESPDPHDRWSPMQLMRFM